jgi:hypothetical protein
MTATRSSIRFLITASAFILAALLIPVQARAAAATFTDVNVSETSFYNACTGENVTITSGTLHIVTQVTNDADGGYHLDMRGNAQNVVAIGDATGTTYHLAGDFWGEQNGRSDGSPQVDQLITLHNVVSEGPSPNVTIHIVTHMTIDANGVVTADITSVNTGCNG